jgi:hypothetical protein
MEQFPMMTAKVFLPPLAAVCTVFSVSAAVAEPPQTPSPVARLAAMEGTVLVEHGNGYATAEAGMPLHAADRIFVLEDSQATLTFADGCTEEVPGPELRTLAAGDSCQQPPSLEAVTAEAAESPEAARLMQAATSDERRLAAAWWANPNAGLIGLGVAGAGGVAWAASEGLGSDDRDTPPPRQRQISP